MTHDLVARHPSVRMSTLVAGMATDKSGQRGRVKGKGGEQSSYAPKR